MPDSEAVETDTFTSTHYTNDHCLSPLRLTSMNLALLENISQQLLQKNYIGNTVGYNEIHELGLVCT